MYRITARTFEVTERGHLTDRYSKAIEQLGSQTLDVRLGGIYALEQIATDSPRTRDQATIVEVLSAFIRVHSDPIYQYKAAQDVASRAQIPNDDQELIAAADYYMTKSQRSPVDVQAAVTVLGRLPPLTDVARGNLEGAWLARIDINRANLTGIRLNGANLTGARFQNATLTRAWLIGADLTCALLHEANLAHALLQSANLTNTRLQGANLTGAQLFMANLTDAWLEGVDLTGTWLGEAKLAGARGLTQEQVDAAVGDQKTSLPMPLRRPKSWHGEA
ncbi:MAG: pentapeptide repeat-containing protein [Actinobacteria bacterium]|nr:pentapeptide repeat-containing protein [Actinomycetota bacterium]